MKMTPHGYTFVIGVDISKAKLDITWGSNGPLESIDNTEPAIAQQIVSKIKEPANTVIVMEATGGWLRKPVGQLLDLITQENNTLIKNDELWAEPKTM